MRSFALLAVCLVIAAGPARGQGTPAGADGLAGLSVTPGGYADISTGPTGPPLGGSTSDVGAIAVAPDGTLYAGGTFGAAGGTVLNKVARWDGSAWRPLGSGLNTFVNALALAPDGSLYAGGGYTLTGGLVARWDGSAWSTLGSVNNVVQAVAVAPDGSVYVGGEFTTAGGAPASRVARWDGTSWSPLGTGMNSDVAALAVAPDGSVYAGGRFTAAGGAPASYVARSDGTAWSALGSGIDFSVPALSLAPDGALYAGGGPSSGIVARWDGTAWSALGSRVDRGVFALVGDASGDLFIGGDFERAGAVVSPYVVKYDARPVSAEGGGGPAVAGVRLTVFPNPVGRAATVHVELDAAGPARVAVVDLLGRTVAVLADGVLAAGDHAFDLDAGRLAPGVYVVRVTSGKASVVRRVTVVR